MTRTVCFNCGAIKFGALVPCNSCGQAPAGEDDLTVSLMMTDHYLDTEKLSALGAEVASGRRPELDAAARARFAPALAEYRRLVPGRLPKPRPPPVRHKRWWWPFRRSG